jgi:protein-S-isoprenylcysteine O-methyltransferase Ste14
MCSANQPSRDALTASVANPVVRPPLVVLASLLLGAVLTVTWPLSFVPHVFRLPVGCLLVAMAAALFSYSIKQFRMAGTPVPGNKPTTAIVRTGLSLQPESNLPGVLRVTPWPGDLGQ